MLGLELDVGAWAKPPCFCMDFYTFQTNGYANRTCGASFMDQPSWTLHLGNGDWRCGTRFVCSLGRQFGLWVLGHAARDPLTGSWDTSAHPLDVSRETRSPTSNSKRRQADQPGNRILLSSSSCNTLKFRIFRSYSCTALSCTNM